ASLVVVASRSFDTLVPASFGDVASRVVRGAHCPVLAVRDLDADPARRTAILERVVALRDESRQALERGELERAEVALRVASTLLPGHAAIEDDLATVCDRADRPDAADRHRRAARALRSLHA
ncbi:MAG: universal stress protein, partial [Deltaproteobacteria bacterium]|nr:universal stress protein [Deltaproteobacteria bacterium]